MTEPLERKEDPTLATHKDSASTTSTTTATTRTLHNLTFDNRVLRSVPVGRDGQPGTVFSRLPTTPLANPHIVCLSPPALALLDLSPAQLLSDPTAAAYLSASQSIPGSESASHCYCGHQFGVFAGQLGDGAVCYAGEVLNGAGERWELQYKGSGLTPYSRSADGRKVLRSSLREFLASEAMAALGVPTTRAASLCTSDTLIVRDQFYTGDARRERASVVTRLAQSFIRFGSFELCKRRDPRSGASGPCVGKPQVIRQLMDYVCASFYTEAEAQYQKQLAECSGDEQRERAREQRDVRVYGEIVRRTARMIAQWQCCGFVHGVMNTDNMSVLGLTIDYGPYQWLDGFIPSATSNTSDEQYRYAYERQPSIGHWDLSKLGESFALMRQGGAEGERRGLAEYEAALEAEYWPAYHRAYYGRMRAKLGLSAAGGVVGEASEEDKAMVHSFLAALEATCGDMTNCFRVLSSLSLDDAHDNSATVLSYLVEQSSSAATYTASLAPRVEEEQLAYFAHVMANNPNVRDSSGLIEGERQRKAKREAVAGLDDARKAERDRALWSEWLGRYRRYSQRVWSGALDGGERRRGMNSVNPKYVLRNWMAQVAIERAEAGDYSECQQLLGVLLDPYAVEEDEAVVREGEAKGRQVEREKGAGKYTCKPPKNYENVLCSCSS